MRSKKPGSVTSKIKDVEVLNISERGIWIYVGGKEYFLGTENYPWFRNATIAEICSLEILHGRHLHWPDLDVDLELDCLENPDKYPLEAK